MALFGRGWTTMFARRLILNTNGAEQIASVVTATNQLVTFRKTGGTFRQTWPTAKSAYDTLTYDAGAGTYLHRAAGSSELARFRATDGRLLALRDLVSGREVQFTYDAQGLPQSVKDSWTGASWLLTLDPIDRRVTSIEVGGRPDLVWSYTYDTNDNLVGVLAPGSATWRTYPEFKGELQR